MKPRFKYKTGFWQCTTPDVQGIGVTPVLAWREYVEEFIVFENYKLKRMEEEDRARRIEQHKLEMLLQMQATCMAFGMVMYNNGKVVRDLFREAHDERISKTATVSAKPAAAMAPTMEVQTHQARIKPWAHEKSSQSKAKRKSYLASGVEILRLKLRDLLG